MSRSGLRTAVDSILRADGLTPRRFMALACVSAAATAVVVADATGPRTSLPQIVAAAEAARTPVVRKLAPPRASAVAAVHTPVVAGDHSSGTTTPAAAQPVASTPAPVSAPAPARTNKTTHKQQPAKTTPAKPSSPIKHVFVIALAGTDGAALWGTGSPAPYLATTLRPQGTLLTGYQPLDGGDLASLVAVTSGQAPTPETAQNCPTYQRFVASGKPDASGGLVGNGCIYPDNMLTLADQLTIARQSWRAYSEDMSNDAQKTAACRRPAQDAADDTQTGRAGDEYAADHNPFVYYGSLVDLGDCLSNDVPLTQLTTDLAGAKTTPSFVYVAPNLCHGGWEATCADGSPGAIGAADAFAKQWAQAILDSPAYREGGLLIVLFGTVPAGTQAPGALLVSRYVKPGATDAKPFGPYALLRGVEDIFGLTHLAHAGDSGLPDLPLTG
ncbi:MAG TPA: hypothetical protein VE570_10365 [Thermoleophilaceae bacterium]|jgi:hypothetical protein|nr:hypothetical protein [Thermoleophilaceae bacterium]